MHPAVLWPLDLKKTQVLVSAVSVQAAVYLTFSPFALRSRIFTISFFPKMAYFSLEYLMTFTFMLTNCRRSRFVM